VKEGEGGSRFGGAKSEEELVGGLDLDYAIPITSLLHSIMQATLD
jgi:hypothetical protein